MPGSGFSDSRWTIRLQDVRPVVCPWRLVPSTRISNLRPTSSWLSSRWIPVWSARSSEQAARRDVGRDFPGAPPPCRRRARPGRVAEGEEARESDVAHEGERVLEVVLGLSRKTDDEIRGQRQAGHALAEPGRGGAVLRRRVAALHPGEHAVGAGLRRQVQVRSERRNLGERRDERVVHEARVGSDEAQPTEPRDPADAAQELAEVRTPSSGSRYAFTVWPSSVTSV